MLEGLGIREGLAKDGQVNQRVLAHFSGCVVTDAAGERMFNTRR
jgi:hypothetical protein